MNKIAVINESNVYNLGTEKIYTQLKNESHEVFYSHRADLWSLDTQKAYISGIFTWDLPKICHDANLLKSCGIEVEIGGPAATAMPEYIEKQTGITPHLGVDPRFEHVKGEFRTTFTSRGCPHSCEFCLVPVLEGRKMIEYSDFNIPKGENPWVCDNNILATSWGHQNLVVEKLKHVRNLDINSGFDCRIFSKDPEKYWSLYSQLHLERWRFAYDIPEEKDPMTKCVEFLHAKGVRYSEISVFCLIGGPGQTFDHCLEKIQYLIKIETSPYPQRYRPLNILTSRYTPPGWNVKDLDRLFQWGGVANVWRSCTWDEFMDMELGIEHKIRM